MDSKLYNQIGKAVETARKNNGSLTEQNLLYVVKVATDIANKTGADLETLIGEGVIAMMKAEEKYDPSKNNSFAKAAAMAVRGYMLNSINRQVSGLSEKDRQAAVDNAINLYDSGNARPDSLPHAANMVREYDRRQDEKKQR
jgi:DNA-directed RNA polymerase specialized sigma subunit